MFGLDGSGIILVCRGKRGEQGLYCEACLCGRRSLRWLNVEACRAMRMVYIPGKCLSAVECSHGERHIWTGMKRAPYNNTRRKAGYIVVCLKCPSVKQPGGGLVLYGKQARTTLKR